MTAVLVRALAAGEPGVRRERATPARAQHPSEAFLIACVLAEHANPLRVDPPEEYVFDILSRHLDGPHAPIVAWRERVVGGELSWRWHWKRACVMTREHFPELLSIRRLPTYDEAVFTLPT